MKRKKKKEFRQERERTGYLCACLIIAAGIFVFLECNLFHVTSLLIDKHQIVTDIVWIICSNI